MKNLATMIKIVTVVVLSTATVVLLQKTNRAETKQPDIGPPGAVTGSDRKEVAMKKSLGAKTVLLPTPVWVIGSYDAEGKPNVMTAAWVGICCSRPPCVAVSLRKATYTYGNIVNRKAFTVNIPPETFAGETAYWGSVSGRDTDKFKAARLTPAKSSLVDAPYVKEFPLVIECKLLHTFELGLHTMFVAEIMDVKADGSILGDDGMPDAKKLKPFLYAPGSRSFYGIGDCLGDVPTLAKKVK